MRRGRRKTRPDSAPAAGGPSYGRPPSRAALSDGRQQMGTHRAARGSAAASSRASSPPAAGSTSVHRQRNRDQGCGDEAANYCATASSAPDGSNDGNHPPPAPVPSVLSDPSSADTPPSSPSSSSPSEEDDRVSVGSPATAATRSCASIFNHVEELYGFPLLRGAKPLSEDQFSTVRGGYNLISSVTLPSLTRVRYQIVPRVHSWLLPRCSSEVSVLGTTEMATMHNILPSSHLRRDMKTPRTFDLFFAAALRSEADRAMHPEFADSPLFNDRSTFLHAGASIPRFNLDGVSLKLGNVIDIFLDPPRQTIKAT